MEIVAFIASVAGLVVIVALAIALAPYILSILAWGCGIAVALLVFGGIAWLISAWYKDLRKWATAEQLPAIAAPIVMLLSVGLALVASAWFWSAETGYLQLLALTAPFTLSMMFDHVLRGMIEIATGWTRKVMARIAPPSPVAPRGSATVIPADSPSGSTGAVP